MIESKYWAQPLDKFAGYYIYETVGYNDRQIEEMGGLYYASCTPKGELRDKSIQALKEKIANAING